MAVIGVYFTCLMILGGLFVTNYLLAECCVIFGQQMDNLKLSNADEEVMAEKRAEQAQRDAERAISFLSPGVVDFGNHSVDSAEATIPSEVGGTCGRSENVKAATDAEAPAAEDEVQQAESAPEPETEPEPEMEPEEAYCGVKSWLLWLPTLGCVCFCPVDKHARTAKPWWFKRLQVVLDNFILSPKIDSFLTGCITVNFFLLAMDHYGQPVWWAMILEYCNYFLTITFTIEMTIKIVGWGPLGYFGDPMNWLDAVCVITSLMEVLFQSGGGVSALRVLRLMRILRSMKMIKDGSALKQMIETAIASMKAVLNFGVLLLLLIYIFALLGMNLFGGELKMDDGSVPRANFDTFVAAFMAVFQVSTRENWHIMLYSAMQSSPAASVIYFVSLLIMTNYILLALFMGTLLQNFQKHFADVKGAKVGLPSILPLVNVARQKLMSLRAAEKMTTAEIMKQMAADAVEKAKQKALYDDDRSLFLFQKTSPVRIACMKAMAHPYFERSVLFAIAVSSILLAVEHPNDPEGTMKASVLKILDVAFTVFFVGEMTTKIIALGFIGGEDAYAKSTWNQLDGTVVVISIMTLLPGDGDSMKFLRVLRTVRALRPLQAVNKWPGLRTVVQSLANSIPSIMIVNTLAFFFIMIFGILFVQLFGGALYYCSDGDVHPKVACEGSYVMDDGSIGMRLWLNQRRNFDNIIQALLVMFELLTLEEWDSIMYSVVDATDEFHGPTRDNSPGFGFMFIIYIISGSFFILNLFVGVIVSAYNEAKAEAEHGTGMSETQEKRRTDGIKGTHAGAVERYLKLSSETTSRFQRPFLKIIMHPKFEWLVLIAILSNVGFMCLEHVGMSEAESSVSEIANESFAWLFLGEMTVKLLALGPIKYWDQNWNKFDGFIVTVSMVELVWKKVAGGELPVDPTVIRLFRIFRVARFVRMAEKAKGIKNLIQTFMETLPYLVNVATLLSIFIFIYAVVGVALFTNVKHQETITEYMNFHSFFSTVALLVRVSTGEGWAGAMHDCQITGEECSTDAVTGISDCGDPLFAPLYFVTFMLVCTYVSLNVIVAVILFTFFDLEGNPNDKSLGDDDVASCFATIKDVRKESPTEGVPLEGADGMPIIPASQLNDLLFRIKDPLGTPTAFHMTEMSPKLNSWMRKEVKDYDPAVSQIGALELLRFLVVYGFDVDVAPPEKQKKKLWGGSLANKVSVLQESGGSVDVLQGEGGDQSVGSAFGDQSDGSLFKKVGPEPEPELKQMDEGVLGDESSLPGSPDAPLSPGGKDKQVAGEDSLDWMERQVQPSSSGSVQGDENVSSLSELEKVLETKEVDERGMGVDDLLAQVEAGGTGTGQP